MDEKVSIRVSENSFTPVHLSYNTFDPENIVNVVKSPIIFLHGITSCKEAWRVIPQLLANETNRKAYAYDARNHGDSDWSEDFDLEVLVRDLFHLADSLRAHRVILIGHSMGGITAINATLVRPERVEMLIVEDMCVTPPHPKLLSLSLSLTVLAPKAVPLIPAEADETEASYFVMDFIEKNLSSEKKPRSAHGIDPITMALRRLPEGGFELKANMAVLEKAIRNETKSLLAPQESYSGPVCFIYGKLSPFQVLSDAENIQTHFPGVSFVGVENSWHSVHSDSPREFAKAVREFISCHEGN